jgi:ribonuclease R
MKERIIEILNNRDLPSMSISEINSKLELKSIEEFRILEKTLNQMVNEATLYYSDKKKKYTLFENSHLFKGKLSLSSKGYGFVTIEGRDKDVYISRNNINNANDGDFVCIELIDKINNEGKILKIIRPDDSIITGEFFKQNKKNFVKQSHSNFIIEIPAKYTKGAVPGHKVIVEKIGNNKGKITKIIGHKNDVGIEILSFVYEHNFEPQFPEEVMHYLDKIPEEVKESDKKGRLDLRDKVIFTIDGDDTKDIDDAISIEKLDDNTYELGVHIADVSHYVTEGSILDNEAYKRGTSVYLVDRVLPMLPHKLSNGICSLNPDVDRLALSCIMKIDNTGKVTSYKIKKSVIKSRKQMTYNCVNQILDNDIVPVGYEPFVEELKMMKTLSDIIRKKMINRGYIEFHSKEPKIIVDEMCHPIDIKVRTEGTGENMIENFMVIANETVASHIFYRNLPGIYRVHDRPNPDKMKTFFDFLSSRGYVVKGKRGENITSRDFQKILEQLQDKPDISILNTIAIRAQAKAIYSDENIGHFGLGSKCYSHFTSPIRRYPDLTLHRLVKDYDDNYSEETIRKWQQKLAEISIHSSEKEQDSVECERDVEKMKKAEYMEDHIGETFEGLVSGVQKFGLFVELDNTVEGLVKIEDLPNDEYNYVENTMSLIGKKGHKYTFGDKIKVKVVSASMETMMVDFCLGDDDEKEKK